MPIEDRKTDPFKPQQPRIPGVSPAGTPQPPSKSGAATPSGGQGLLAELSSRMPPKGILIGVGCALMLGMVIAWWSHGSSAKEPSPVVALPAETPPPLPPKPAEHLRVAPGVIATTDELARVWSSKRFVFHDAATSADIPAIVVHLPGGTNWALSLREPYGNCELEYIEDLQELSSQYGHHGDHPMVADPCNHSLFDLTKYGPGPNGLVRGQIVQGTAVRPPIAIEIRTKGKEITATRLE